MQNISSKSAQNKSRIRESDEQFTTRFKKSNVFLSTNLEKARQKEPLLFASNFNFERDKLIKPEFERKLARFKNCASYLEFAAYENPEVIDDWKLHNANFCQLPDCPVCAKRIQKRRIATFRKPIERACKKFKFAYMVTLTVKNGSSLWERLDHLISSQKVFRKMGQKGRKGEWSKVKAAYSHIEIKRGKDGRLWHPHYHFLVFTNVSLDYRINFSRSTQVTFFRNKIVKCSKIGREWLKASGDSINVNVQPLKGKNGSIDFGGVMEIFKYSSKLIEEKKKMDPLDLATVLVAGHARRRFNTYGLFRKKTVFDEKLKKEVPNPLYAQASDFVGHDEGKGDPHWFSARWNGKGYANHSCEKKPILPGSLKVDEKQLFFLTARAGVLGTYKRRKYNWLRSRDNYVQGCKDRGQEAYNVNYFESRIEGELEKRDASIKALNVLQHMPEGDFSGNVWLSRMKRFQVSTMEKWAYEFFVKGLEPENIPPAFLPF